MNFEKLHLDVIKGRSEGKIIWQPRIGCWYTDKKFAGVKLPAPYDGKTRPEIFRELGCSARIYEYNCCFKKIHDPRVQFAEHRTNARDTEYVISTPVGTLRSVVRQTNSSWAKITKKWLITCEEDVNIARWIEERCDWQWDQTAYEQTRAEWAGLGAPTIYMPRVNIQHLYIDVMGVEAATYALCDYPQTVEKYFNVLDESHARLARVINNSPIDIINFGDNLHGGTLSPSLFRKYVLPAYLKRNEILHSAGKFTHSHWDGDTKPLLPFARECALDGIEAITPKPQGDVTVEEVKAALGEEMFLIDGIAAILFDDIFPLDQLREQTERLIELFAPKLVLGISDEISSNGYIERIRFVGDIVDRYNAERRKRPGAS